jgi:hypothetical protein
MQRFSSGSKGFEVLSREDLPSKGQGWKHGFGPWRQNHGYCAIGTCDSGVANHNRYCNKFKMITRAVKRGKTPPSDQSPMSCIFLAVNVNDYTHLGVTNKDSGPKFALSWTSKTIVARQLQQRGCNHCAKGISSASHDKLSGWRRYQRESHTMP